MHQIRSGKHLQLMFVFEHEILPGSAGSNADFFHGRSGVFLSFLFSLRLCDDVVGELAVECLVVIELEFEGS